MAFPPHKLVAVKNFPARAFAESAQEVLREHQIASIVQASDIAGTGSAGGCDLYVRDEDKDEALEILTGMYEGL